MERKEASRGFQAGLRYSVRDLDKPGDARTRVDFKTLDALARVLKAELGKLISSGGTEEDAEGQTVPGVAISW